MNNITKPVFYLKIWIGGDGLELIGQELKALEFQYQKQMFCNHKKWSFHGTYATVFVTTPNESIVQSEALRFATAWMLGRYNDYAVNLDRCTVEVLAGINKTPPH